MDQINRIGRPWCSLCWFTEKKVEIINHEILEEGISYLEIKFNPQVVSLIGVYLTSLSTKLEHKIKYSSQLLILKEKLNSCKMEQKRFIIIGDLNGDIKRLRYYTDVKLEEFIRNSHCKSMMNSNEIDYSHD
jgi:hypothetical protein